MTTPPRRCAAHSSRTGEPCRKWAVRGALVCDTHGGLAPQVRGKALERVAFAQELERNPRRHPAEVLADCLHSADVMLKNAIATFDSDPTSMPEQFAILLSLMERAQRFAHQIAQLSLPADDLPTEGMVDRWIRQLEDELARRRGFREWPRGDDAG